MTKLMAIILIAGSALSGTPATHTDAEIYTWIKNKMGITENYEMPTVKHVSQSVLAVMIREKAEGHRKEWEEQNTQREVNEYIDMLAREVRGLFLAANMKVLYVTSDTNTGIYREAIVAHELAHYLQQKSGGDVYGPARWFREMQAEQYQAEYIEEFCPKCNGMGEIVKEEANQ